MLPGEADPAVHLDGVGCDGAERVRAVGLRHRQIGEPVRFGPVERRGDVTCRRQRRLCLQQHVDTHVFDRLEAADGPAELIARPGVVGRHLHAVHCAPGLFGDQRHRCVIEGDVERGASGVSRTDESGRGAVQGDPGLPAGLVHGAQRRHFHPGGPAIYGENPGARIRFGLDINPVGSDSVQHVGLLTGHLPAFAGPCRGGVGVLGRTSGAGLGVGHRGD